MKTAAYPEYPALLVAAKKLGRPVHWMSTRSEAFITDNQARDTCTEAELALDEKGKFLALRMRHMRDQGAYIAPAGISINTNNFARCLPGMYDIPKIDFAVALRLHQHGADRALSRRRTPGGELRARARWSRKPRASPASIRRAAQAQSHPDVGHALQDRGRHHLRQRRLRRRVRQGARARATIDSFKQAQARVGRRRSCAASASPACSSMPAALPNEGVAAAFPGGNKLVLASTCSRPARATPRSSPPGRGAARHRRASISSTVMATATSSRGLASVGSRSAMTAGNAIVKTARGDARRRARRSPQPAGSREGDIAIPRRRCFEVVGTDRKISLFETAASRQVKTRARSRKASTPSDKPRRRTPSRTAATSPRWRSTPRPASSTSSPTPPSTIAATCSTT